MAQPRMGSLKEPLDDPRFPHVTYRSGAARWPTPVVRGTGVRVQTLAIAARKWGLAPSAVAENWGLSEAQVEDALAFYEAHQAQIDTAIESEAQVEAAHA